MQYNFDDTGIEIFDSSDSHPRWSLLLKIEIPSIGQNCYILDLNDLKFKMLPCLIYFKYFCEIYNFNNFC
jgi:hypothetical protein